jgi:hypothetical protein
VPQIDGPCAREGSTDVIRIDVVAHVHRLTNPVEDAAFTGSIRSSDNPHPLGRHGGQR